MLAGATSWVVAVALMGAADTERLRPRGAAGPLGTERLSGPGYDGAGWADSALYDRLR